MNDPPKRRRQYLVSTTTNNAAAMTGFLAAGILGFLSVALLVCSLISLTLLFFGGLVIVVSLVGALAFGTVSLITAWLAKMCVTVAKGVPCPAYVPPVREQIHSLPADEILLRGSDQPAAVPGELLRAAHEGTDATAAEELLRSTENGMA